MRKFSIILLSALLLLGLSTQVWAEQSSSSQSGKYYAENQVYVMAYNNATSAITSNSVVILDTTATEGSTLGAYITTSTTADDYRVFGVTDDPSCAAGAICRVCVRGPHLVLYTSTTHDAGTIAAQSGTAEQAVLYSTADGTVGGQLGHVIDASVTEGGNYATIWVNPQVHK